MERIWVRPANAEVPVNRAGFDPTTISAEGEEVEFNTWIARRVRDGSLVQFQPPAPAAAKKPTAAKE